MFPFYTPWKHQKTKGSLKNTSRIIHKKLPLVFLAYSSFLFMTGGWRFLAAAAYVYLLLMKLGNTKVIC